MKIYTLIMLAIGLWVRSDAQTYFVSDEFISFSAKIKSTKDDLRGIELSVFNNSDEIIYLCKRSGMQSPIFVNMLDGPVIVGSGAEYGFNQDYSNSKAENYEVVRVEKKDSAVFYISVESFTSRKVSSMDFLRAGIGFKIDYVVSKSPLIFSHSQNIYEDFINHRKRLTVSVTYLTF